MAEYDNELTFEFSKKLPKGLPGIIEGSHITINANMPFVKSVAILAEEIGHHETSVGDILDYSSYSNSKQENKARRWGYRKLIPYSKLVKFIEQSEAIANYEIAEEFGIPDNVVEEAINMYRIEGYI